jgi:hypothetical protein
MRAGLDEGSSKRGVIQEQNAGGVVVVAGRGGAGAREKPADVANPTQSKKN